jgi:hypothetical protein
LLHPSITTPSLFLIQLLSIINHIWTLYSDLTV